MKRKKIKTLLKNHLTLAYLLGTIWLKSSFHAVFNLCGEVNLAHNSIFQGYHNSYLGQSITCHLLLRPLVIQLNNP